jgi:hypothetical protein
MDWSCICSLASIVTRRRAAPTLNVHSMADTIREASVEALRTRPPRPSRKPVNYTKYFADNSSVDVSEDESPVESVDHTIREESSTNQSKCESTIESAESTSEGESSTDQSEYSSDSGFVTELVDPHGSDTYSSSGSSEDDSTSDRSSEFDYDISDNELHDVGANLPWRNPKRQ